MTRGECDSVVLNIDASLDWSAVLHASQCVWRVSITIDDQTYPIQLYPDKSTSYTSIGNTSLGQVYVLIHLADKSQKHSKKHTGSLLISTILTRCFSHELDDPPTPNAMRQEKAKIHEKSINIKLKSDKNQVVITSGA